MKEIIVKDTYPQEPFDKNMQAAFARIVIGRLNAYGLSKSVQKKDEK